MRIAVIGTGISGMTAAHLLGEGHDLVVFEANDYIGGHSHTVPVEWEGRRYDVDTGFIVFNSKNYPRFSSLLERIGVESQRSDMSFGVSCPATGLEYRATSLNTLFAQRGNIFKPSVYRIMRGALRFNRDIRAWLGRGDWETTLADFLRRGQYSKDFTESFILPMASAIWSAAPGQTRSIPIRLLAQFFANHGFLDVRDQPAWRSIRGGSHSYVRALTEPFADRVRLGCPVESVRRHTGHVEICTGSGAVESADAVIIAAHSDQALAMLADPSREETEILGAIPYQENEVVLHTDESILPRNPRARASWNVHVYPREEGRVSVTYNMNMLQAIDAPVTFCLTLNRTGEIDPSKILFRTAYSHPVYTAETARAQLRREDISGINRTWYCGAYWGYGFHEDGVVSALSVCRDFGRTLL